MLDLQHSQMAYGDISCTLYRLQERSLEVLGCLHEELTRPSVLYRPRMFIDGDSWCVMYGENVQDAVCGFGASPAEAIADFNRAWFASLPENRGAK